MFRAQRNPYGFIQVLSVPSDYEVKDEHAQGLDAQMERNQAWTLAQAGKTFKILPTEVVHLPQPSTELQGNDIWLRLREHLDANWYFDVEGERIQFGNPKRVIIHATLMTPLPQYWNMWGRRTWNVPLDPTNPIDPWGPSAAGGPTGKVVDVLAGLLPTSAIHPDPNYAIPLSDGATLHEAWHSIGFPHATDALDGPAAWLDPMGAQWNMWRGQLLPRTIDLIHNGLSRHFFLA